MSTRAAQSTADELPLFPDLLGSAAASASVDLQVQAAEVLTLARACLPKLWDIDRAAARLLGEAPGVPLRGRCALELARLKKSAGVPAHFFNRLAQVAQRRWKVSGLPVTFSRQSAALDLITDAEWLSLPLAPELALSAKHRPDYARA